ncbi:hypothetical protein ACLBOM_31855 [Escherichia coli]
MADHCANSSGDGSGRRFGYDPPPGLSVLQQLDQNWSVSWLGVNPVLLVLATAAVSTPHHINDHIFLVVQRLL